MSTRKPVNFYYSLTNDNNKTVYRTLGDAEYHEVKEKDNLDYNKTINIRMDANFTACDEDLYKYREQLTHFNDEIKQSFFKNENGTGFRVDVFNYNTINDAIYNIVTVNSDQKLIKRMSKIYENEFRALENCQSCGLMGIDKDILEKWVSSYGYDFSKFYFNMMKKIRIPLSEPIFQLIDTLD